MWYFVLDDGDSRIVIGNGGFKGRPAKGVVEIGYSLVPEFQQKGYATEAVTALLDWAFAHDDVCSVIAETLPELAASQGLLRKLGFRPIDGKGSPGVIRFELSKHCGGDGRQSSDTRPFLPALTAKF
jgi:RimJ/RimL family protein N-acetyltransferase